jgi:hypothetical protein
MLNMIKYILIMIQNVIPKMSHIKKNLRNLYVTHEHTIL